MKRRNEITHMNIGGMRVGLALVFAPVIALVTASELATAQCPEWSGGFELRGTDHTVYALEVLDTGSGPRLYAGGAFGTVGGTRSNFVARTDGSAWSAMPGLTNQGSGWALALTSFDSGSGAEIFAAGFLVANGQATPAGLAKWDGVAWAPVQPPIPTTSIARSFAVFDDGSGPQLYVGTSNGVFAWDGASWTTITTAPAFELAVFDDGSGRALYAAGTFTQISGVPANRVAKWNGSTWSALGSGVSGPVGPRIDTLAMHDFGAGARLIAGGRFTSAGGSPANNIAMWDGATWSPLGSGLDGFEVRVEAMASYDGGDGSALYVGGDFETAGGVPANSLARFDGATWSALGTGIVQGITQTAYQMYHAPVSALVVHDAGGGPRLVVGGAFSSAGGVDAVNLAQWDGTSWSRVVEGQGFMDPIRALTVGDDGTGGGPTVFAGGTDFLGLSPTQLSSSHVWKWTGASWQSIGALNGGIKALLFFSETPGACARLHAAGSFTEIGGVAANNIARWNGATWEPLGVGTSGIVNALAIYDRGSGPELVAAGEFETAGGASAFHIAHWNGSSWGPMGSISGPVNALEVFDDGIGTRPALYVGGEFHLVGSNGVTIACENLARWDGTSHTPVGAFDGLNGGEVFALRVWDDGLGGGPALYVGGDISSVGGVAACGIARWNGSAWSAVGSGNCATTPVRSFLALAAFDDGSGPALFGGGSLYFGTDPTGASGIAKWDGTTWTLLDGGLIEVETFDHVDVPGVPSALVAFDGRDGESPSLFIGGRFRFAGDEGSSNIARWQGCTLPPGNGFCFGDGSLGVPCPCAPPNVVPNPSGAPDAGCANAFQLEGAKLYASGRTNPDNVVLQGSGLTPSGYTLFFVGTAEIAAGIAYGDGVRCTGGALVRFGPQFATCGSVRYPNPALGHTLPLSVVSSVTPGSGQTRWYQGFYRHAVPNFCNSGTTNFTSGYRIVW
ncbi:MAG: hypothetical protein ACKVWV_08440 [Planctomycetota bacterium]